jgi:hypothetical protein
MKTPSELYIGAIEDCAKAIHLLNVNVNPPMTAERLFAALEHARSATAALQEISNFLRGYDNPNQRQFNFTNEPTPSSPTH